MLWVHCVLAELACISYFSFLDLRFLIRVVGAVLLSLCGMGGALNEWERTEDLPQCLARSICLRDAGYYQVYS